jgi:hypothetical protein
VGLKAREKITSQKVLYITHNLGLPCFKGKGKRFFLLSARDKKLRKVYPHIPWASFPLKRIKVKLGKKEGED